MNSTELADEVQETIDSMRHRILATGRLQYADLEDEVQKFEKLPFKDLCTMLEEEIDDGIVYLVMMRIRFRRTREVFEELERRYNSANRPAQ